MIGSVVQHRGDRGTSGLRIASVTMVGQFPDGIDLHVRNLRWALTPADHIFIVTRPDIMVTLSQDAYAKFGKELKDDGTLIIEQDLVRIGDACRDGSLAARPVMRQLFAAAKAGSAKRCSMTKV